MGFSIDRGMILCLLSYRVKNQFGKKNLVTSLQEMFVLRACPQEKKAKIVALDIKIYIGKEQIGMPDPDFDDEMLNAKKIKLKDRLLAKQKFGYLYDFGDNWEHSVIVEKVLDSADAPFIPFCIGGERASPPEDCGSIPGYYELQKIKKNKNHKEYKERIVGWLGEDFDFEHFDLDETNKELHRLVKIDGRTRYWVLK